MNQKYNLYIMACMFMLPSSLSSMNTRERVTDYKNAYESQLKEMQGLAANIGSMTQEQLQSFHKLWGQTRKALDDMNAQRNEKSSSMGGSQIRGVGITDEYIIQQRALLLNLQKMYTDAQAALMRRGALLRRARQD